MVAVLLRRQPCSRKEPRTASSNWLERVRSRCCGGKMARIDATQPAFADGHRHQSAQRFQAHGGTPRKAGGAQTRSAPILCSVYAEPSSRQTLKPDRPKDAVPGQVLQRKTAHLARDTGEDLLSTIGLASCLRPCLASHSAYRRSSSRTNRSHASSRPSNQPERSFRPW